MKDKFEAFVGPLLMYSAHVRVTLLFICFLLISLLFIFFLFYIPYNTLFVIIIINILYTVWHYNLQMYLISLIKI